VFVGFIPIGYVCLFKKVISDKIIYTFSSHTKREVHLHFCFFEAPFLMPFDLRFISYFVFFLLMFYFEGAEGAGFADFDFDSLLATFDFLLGGTVTGGGGGGGAAAAFDDLLF